MIIFKNKFISTNGCDIYVQYSMSMKDGMILNAPLLEMM